MITNKEDALRLLKEIEVFFNNRDKARDKWIGDVLLNLPTEKVVKNTKEFLNNDDVCILRIRYDHEGYSDGILWVNYELVWKVLSEEHNMSYERIQAYIKDKMEEHLYWYMEPTHCFSSPDYKFSMINKL
jgi:hypothetical protein